MITAEEAVLTPGERDLLTETVTGAKFTAILHKWNPTFATQAEGVGDQHDFTSIVHGGVLYRATSQAVECLVDGAWTAVGSFVQAVGQLDTPPSLVSDTLLHLFVPTASGISHSTWDGAAWAAWSEIVTQSNIWYVAATAVDTVHFVSYDPVNFYFQFKVYNGSILASDIYWGYPITSFSALRVGVRDVLTFTANLPGVSSAKTEGTQLVKYIVPAGGVFAIPYQYGSWGDHVEIEKIDEWSAYRYRQALCLSKIDDTLWLTTYGSDGDALTTITGIRAYTSKDGLNWSRGELLSIPIPVTEGAQLQRIGNMLYALTRDGHAAAPSTLWFGLSAASEQLDITDQVLSLDVQWHDIQQIALLLGNQNNWAADSILNGENSLALLLRTGYGSTLIQTGLYDVDSLEFDQDYPVRALKITARDRLAWLDGLSQSEQFKNWMPQALGMDEYVDNTGTGYGGMSHTAPERGSYRASDGSLQLKSSNAEGIAISTFMYDDWNGAVEVLFQLSMLANGEYAGVVIRLQDADNGLSYIYNQDDDKLKLISRVAGVDTGLWESDAKGWSGALSPHCLRAEFRYSRVRLYSGAYQGAGIGIQWSLENSLLLTGQNPVLNPMTQIGYVGTRGKGYSEQDSFVSNPPPFPAPILSTIYPPYPLPAPPAEAPAPGPAPIRLVIVSNVENRVELLQQYYPITEFSSWSDRSFGLSGKGLAAMFDRGDPHALWVVTDQGLYKAANIETASGFSLINTNLGLFGDGSRVGYKIIGADWNPGWQMILAMGNVAVKTSNAWGLINYTTLDGLPDSYTDSGTGEGAYVGRQDAMAAPLDENHVYSLVQTRRNRASGLGDDTEVLSLYHSTNGGETFTLVNPDIASAEANVGWTGFPLVCKVVIPPLRADNSPNYDNASCEILALFHTKTAPLGPSNIRIWRSVDQGATFSEVYAGAAATNFLTEREPVLTQLGDGQSFVWVEGTRNPTTSVYDIEVVRTNNLFAATTRSGVLASTSYKSQRGIGLDVSPLDNARQAVFWSAEVPTQAHGGGRFSLDEGVNWYAVVPPPAWVNGAGHDLAFAAFCPYIPEA